MAVCNQTLDQVVYPHNDFFTAQFLVPFPLPGTYTAVIHTRLVDKEEQTWKPSGLNTVLNIKAFEDGQSRIQQQSSAASGVTPGVGGASNSRR